MPLLTIANLSVAVDKKPIIHGINLTIEEGELHAIMGPNGSGKSTLVNALMGHPLYEVTSGSVTFRGKDLLSMDPHERALAGLFLAFQYPKEIAGVTLRSFLFAALKAHMKERPSIMEEVLGSTSKALSPVKFKAYLTEKIQSLKMDPAFAERFVNQGFSGGEKKKAEILQLHVLKPELALLDETDSGLDVDALKIVADGIRAVSMSRPHMGALIVTHYARILEYINVDHVHVMVDGTIVESGGPEFAKKLEKEGYEHYEG